jgi:FtsZ-interacting cell division protein ZipA
MVNPLGINGQSTPDKNGGKSIEHSLDNSLPENSQENLDTRLDHAIEETFPTSDPVSVTITKGPEPDRSDQEANTSSADDQQDQPEHGSTEQVLDQVREALNDIAESASEAAGSVYSYSERYAQHVGEQYPQAQHYVREGQRLVSRQTTGSPLLSLFIAGALGYVLAWMIHGERRNRGRHVPDYARTRPDYASQGDNPNQK